MTNITYLQPRCIKGFVVRSQTVEAAMSAVTGTLCTTGGNLLFESPLTKNATFCLVSFENETKLLVWESIFLTAVKQRVQDAEKMDVPSIKILMLKGDNEQKIIEMIKAMNAKISFYSGTILRTKRLDRAAYEAIVFFADSQRAEEFQKTFDIQP